MQSDVGSNMSPQFDWVHELLLRALNLITRNPITSVNVWILLSFGIASVFAFILMRSIGITRFTATVCSLAFSLLPYHFIRMQHASVIQYQWTPCLVFVLIIVIDKSIIQIQNKNQTRVLIFSCLFISGSGPYALFYSLILVFLFSALKMFSVRTEIRSFRKLVLQFGPFLLLSIGAVIQTVFFRIFMNTNSQQLLYPKREGGDAILYSTRAFEFLIPSGTSPWHRILFSWISRKILVPDVNLCPPGEFSKYANLFVCNAKVEGGTYGSLSSTIAVYITLVAGVFFLAFFKKEIARELRTLFAILLVVLMLVTSYGGGTVLAALIPAARKTGVLTPFVTLLFIVIAAIIAGKHFQTNKKIFKYGSVILVSVVFISENVLSNYSQVRETRDNQELIKTYSKTVDQILGSKCTIFKVPVAVPRYDPAAVSPSEYLPALYSHKARWVFVDRDVTSIEQTNIADNLWWIVGSARAKGYCALELSNPNYVSTNGLNFNDTADFIETTIGLTRILESKDRNIRLYSLKSGRRNEKPLVNILDGGYVREPVSTGGSWRWVKSIVRYRFFSSVRQCVQMKTHVASFGGASAVKLRIDNFDFINTKTDVDISEYITLNQGVSVLTVRTLTGDKVLANGHMGAAYLFDPVVNPVSQDLCH
jgi:hypothetical protein